MGGRGSASSNEAFMDEMSQKGYVGLSGEESDSFMSTYHNEKLFSKGANTMDGAQAGRINGALRRGEMPNNEKDRKMVEQLDAAIQKNELPQDMTLFRGVPLSAFSDTGAFSGFKPKTVSMDNYKKSDGRIDYDAWGKAYRNAEAQNNATLLQMSKSLIGKRVTDGGFLFVSASSQRSAFHFSDVSLQIRAKKGTKAYISNYKAESEIILGRGKGIKIVGSSMATVKANNGAQKQVLQLIAELD